MKKMKLQKVASFRAKVLRLLKMDGAFGQSLSDEGEVVRGGICASNFHDYRKEIQTAWLEAERRKAEAQMEWQRHRLLG